MPNVQRFTNFCVHHRGLFRIWNVLFYCSLLYPWTALARGPQLLHYAPFFHTSQHIHTALDNIKRNCALNMTVDSQPLGPADTSAFFDIVTLHRGTHASDDPETAPRKSFFLFGEHSRELVSTESGFSFLKYLCNPHSFSDSAATQFASPKISDSFTVKLVLNANPLSRMKVEHGRYCLRTNEHGTDLNRNWDVHWDDTSRYGAETYSGPHPFSEVETRIVRDAIKAFNPDIFVTVHSGGCAYLSPDAFSTLPSSNENVKRWNSIVSQLTNHGPDCITGPTSHVIGYPAPGTCLDYAYEVLNVPLAFAFEIYSGVDLLQNRSSEIGKTAPTEEVNYSTHARRRSHVRQTTSFLQQNLEPDSSSPIPDSQSLGFNSEPRPNFSQLQNATEADLNNFACFYFFNPVTHETFQRTLTMWNENYAYLIALPAETRRM